ncbi:uncharacterized protein [Palaemon carinicauda]|uniref:uncharacterized protein n=1 Tax=Palaemon carinicauda TaxID=392227 RepID=UPI0035B69803
MSELQFSYWIEQGRRIGLEGNGLGEWATRKYEAGLQREENKEQERQEREEKKEKERQEREERAKERELRKYEIDRSLEERRLALEEAKLALDKQRIDDGIQESTAPKVSGIKPPRLLPYNEDEDITAYIIRFESVASLCEWPVSEWATRLALLFSGTALNIYSTLSEEEIADYVSLKAAVLRAFKRTPEQYRKEFRFAKMSSKINFSQFMTQLFRHFDYWFHSSDVDDSFENLREFIVVDQFLTVLPHDIRLFIKEQELWKAKDVAEAADRFAGAHRCYPGDKQTQKKSLNPKPSPVVTQRPTPLCYVCGEAGHMARSCPKGKAAMTSTPGTSSNKAGSNKVGRYASKETHSRAPFTHGVVNGSRVSTILRDTGCSTCIVSKDLFPNLNERELPKSSLIDYLGRENVFPVLPVYIGCKWFTGKVNAIIAPIKFCTVLLGNIEGALFPEDGDCPPLNSIDEEPRRNHLPTEKGKAIEHVNITTRSASRKVVHPLVFPDVEALETTPIDFIKLQNECATLESIRKDCQANTIKKNSKVEYRYVRRNEVLYKEIINANNSRIANKFYLVVPLKLRKVVLKLAHDLPVAGHFSHRKTLKKIRELYFWPGMCTDVYAYCRSCDNCQRNTSKGRHKRVSMVKMPVVSIPFSRVGIDIVGPLNPSTSEGHRFILTMIDYATGFPEAIPMKTITTVDVADALMQIFSRVGIPKEIISDRGKQFTSELMEHVYQMLGVKPLFTTPYHPAGNGRCERQHSVLKSILKKLCHLQPREWHRYLPCALFAMREIPSDTLGFSPFELLYGYQVRGPLLILNEIWTNTDLSNDTQNVYSFLFDLRNRLEETSKIAQENIKTSMEIYSTYFDKKSTRRQFKVNDEVLLLLPTEHNKLLVEWQGPFKVLRKLNSVDYIIDVKGKPKTFHVNLLKAYFYRSQNVLSVADENLNSSISDYCCVTSHVIVLSEDIENPIPCVEEEITSELDICPTLTPEQKGKLEEVLDNFSEVFSEIPGCTSTIMHKIELTSTEPIRKKMYPVPAHLKEEVCKEVDKLLKLGIIEESKSDYCNPIVMIKKPDNTFRLALDFRALNSVTKFDSEPMPSIDEDLFKFRNMSFITELDITKAYHQVMLDPNARPLTAFPTYRGLMQYKRLPFGLVTACATYVRLMKKIFQGMNHISIYFDNIFVMSNTFQEHLETLSEVLRRLRDHGLTARPSKCHFCYEKVKYLGFEVEINKPFVLRTDASSVGLGAVLLQYDEETAYPVAYASRKLLPREQRYSTIERECLAIFWAVRKFHYYLYGKEFFIETDHKPLTYMETLKSGNDRILRLILGLQPYKYRIIYISGQSNHFSDLLSRSN